MRIAVFATFYHPHVGGYVKNIGELVTRLVERGHSIDVITCNTSGVIGAETIGNLRVLRLPCWNLLKGSYPVPKLSLQLIGLFWHNRYDLVSTQTRFFSLTALGLLFAWVRHIPLVHTERGTQHSVVDSKAVDFVSRVVDHVMGYLISRYAIRCIGVSMAACKFMRHIGIVEIVRIPNGIDIPKEMWRSNGQNTVCFVGRLIKAKGVQDLIAVWGRIHSQFPQSELVIVGDGTYRTELNRLASPSVKFLGEKSSSEVKRILLGSAVFVNPSYSEGLPTSVMEAASLGLPIVATDVGGTRELVSSGRSGWLIQAGNKDAICASVLSLLGDSGLMARFGLEARRNMVSYSWDMVVQQYENLFKNSVR